jgi:phosphatidylserine/phosphatidylglycerophosphate/cardiolipin synthase-like enzyme
VDDQLGAWQKELLKSSPGAHAIIHDKIVVIDPLSPDCVVVTGSHNLGYRASYNNDENLLIISGHRALAEAYAVHVMDVYEHYRWRWLLQRQKSSAFSGLKRTAAEWQGKYFDERKAEVAFWL